MPSQGRQTEAEPTTWTQSSAYNGARIGLTVVVVVLFYRRADSARCPVQCPLTLLFMSDKATSPVDPLSTGRDCLPEPVGDRAQPGAQTQLDAQAQSDASTQPDAQAQPDASMQPEVQAQPDAHAQLDALAQPVANAQPDAQTQLDAQAQLDDLEPEQSPQPDPTRYGDWEKGGRCIDF